MEGEASQRVECVEELVGKVRELQQYALLRHTLHTKVRRHLLYPFPVSASASTLDLRSIPKIATHE